MYYFCNALLPTLNITHCVHSQCRVGGKGGGYVNRWLVMTSKWFVQMFAFGTDSQKSTSCTNLCLQKCFIRNTLVMSGVKCTLKVIPKHLNMVNISSVSGSLQKVSFAEALLFLISSCAFGHCPVASPRFSAVICRMPTSQETETVLPFLCLFILL